MFGIEGGCVRADGMAMDYARFGRGDRRLIVLPGLSDGLATVRGKALLMAKPYRPWFSEFTVYVFSRRRDLPPHFGIADMADDQARALRALGIDRAGVLGVSQGGMIAQLLAADHPALVEKLALAVTAPYANATARANVEAWIGMAKRGDHRALMVDTAEKSYSEACLRKYRRFYPLLGCVGKPRSYARFLANAGAILAFDARGALGRIACPTLIIGGGDDRIVGVQAAHALRDGIAGSRLHVYDGLGHAAYEEAGDFYARVFGFLDEKDQ